MTNSHNVNSGKNNVKIDLSKLKSGVKASDLGLSGDALSLFSSADKNKNGKLDTASELSIFRNSANTYNASKTSSTTNNQAPIKQLSYEDFERNFAFNSASDRYLKSGISQSEKVAYQRLSKEEKINFLRRKGYYQESSFTTICQSDNTRVNTPGIQMARMEANRREEQAHTKKVVAVEKEMVAKESPQSKKYKQHVVSELQDNYKTAKAKFDYQMKKDGWAADVADGVAHLWNNKLICTTGNTADMVRSDLAAYNNQLKTLKAGVADGSFERKFNNYYGVNYNEQNIKAYEKTRDKYENSFAVVNAPKAFKDMMQPYLDNITKLQKEKDAQDAAIRGGYYKGVAGLDHITPKLDAAKAQFMSKMDEIMGNKSKEPSQVKFYDSSQYGSYLVAYNQINSALTKQAKQEEPKCKTLSAQMTNARKKAYGTKNDIVARVENYNASQDAGAKAVKVVANIATNIAINTLAPGAGTVVGSMLYSAGTSIAYEVADVATSETEKFDLKKTAINATIDGVFGGCSNVLVNKYASNVCSKLLNTSVAKTISAKTSSSLTKFVVYEIVSKEGVKIPSTVTKSVTSTVVSNMAGINQDPKKGLSEEELQKAMTVVSETVVFLGTARDNGKISSNSSLAQMTSLAKEHVAATMKNDTTFNAWYNKNQAQFDKMLTEVIKTEMPKMKGKLVVK